MWAAIVGNKILRSSLLLFILWHLATSIFQEQIFLNIFGRVEHLHGDCQIHVVWNNAYLWILSSLGCTHNAYENKLCCMCHILTEDIICHPPLPSPSILHQFESTTWWFQPIKWGRVQSAWLPAKSVQRCHLYFIPERHAHAKAFLVANLVHCKSDRTVNFVIIYLNLVCKRWIWRTHAQRQRCWSISVWAKVKAWAEEK